MNNIVGAVIISQIDFIDIVIPNLLKFCDYVLVVMDTECNEVEEKIYEYQRNNYCKIFVRRSSMPQKLFTKVGKEVDYHRRWKSIKSYVRNDVFVNLRIMLDSGLIPEISILIFPDQDEIFTDSLPSLLETLVQSNYKGVSLKMVHVVNDLFTIKKDAMMHHFHIMKWSKDLCGIPWQNFNLFHPITNNDIMKVENYSVHLCYLTEKQRAWRNDNWKGNDLIGCELWKLPRIVTEMTPEEITNTFNREPDEKLS